MAGILKWQFVPSISLHVVLCMMYVTNKLELQFIHRTVITVFVMFLDLSDRRIWRLFVLLNGKFPQKWFIKNTKEDIVEKLETEPHWLSLYGWKPLRLFWKHLTLCSIIKRVYRCEGHKSELMRTEWSFLSEQSFNQLPKALEIQKSLQITNVTQLQDLHTLLNTQH